MSKIKITEEQLKRLVENKNKQVVESVEEPVKPTEEKKEEVINESIEKVKSNFKRFI